VLQFLSGNDRRVLEETARGLLPGPLLPTIMTSLALGALSGQFPLLGAHTPDGAMRAPYGR
jgi:hypothetical protein